MISETKDNYNKNNEKIVSSNIKSERLDTKIDHEYIIKRYLELKEKPFCLKSDK